MHVTSVTLVHYYRQDTIRDTLGKGNFMNDNRVKCLLIFNPQPFRLMKQVPITLPLDPGHNDGHRQTELSERTKNLGVRRKDLSE